MSAPSPTPSDSAGPSSDAGDTEEPYTPADLPADCLRLLFSAVEHPQDLCVISLVCKQWNRVSSSSDCWQPRVMQRWCYGSAAWDGLKAADHWKQLYAARHQVGSPWFTVD